MGQKIANLVGQQFGTRLVLENICEESDWISINKPVPENPSKYVLCKCLNCGAIIPTHKNHLRRQPPKRCTFCSNIGNHYHLDVKTNEWVKRDDIVLCNVTYNNTTISFYIDLDDYDLVSQYTWRVVKKKNKFYVITGSFKNGTEIYLHRLLCNDCDDTKEVDHIDGNSLNNRRINLRAVSRQENIDNIRAPRTDSKTGIRGVSQDKRTLNYIVDFSYHGKRYYFKPWGTLAEAVYCRRCVEEQFGKHLVEVNPLARLCELKDDELKRSIKEYVISKIS